MSAASLALACASVLQWHVIWLNELKESLLVVGPIDGDALANIAIKHGGHNVPNHGERRRHVNHQDFIQPFGIVFAHNANFVEVRAYVTAHVTHSEARHVHHFNHLPSWGCYAPFVVIVFQHFSVPETNITQWLSHGNEQKEHRSLNYKRRRRECNLVAHSHELIDEHHVLNDVIQTPAFVFQASEARLRRVEHLIVHNAPVSVALVEVMLDVLLDVRVTRSRPVRQELLWRYFFSPNFGLGPPLQR